MTATTEGRVMLVRARRIFDQLSAGLQETAIAHDAVLRATDHDPLRSVTVAQLRALVAVDDTGGFAAAARALGISRAALHRAARNFERAAEAVLFERTSFGVRPTRQAAELARRIRLASAEYVQAREEIGAHTTVVRGRTVIGAMPLARSWLVPQAVLGFAAPLGPTMRSRSSKVPTEALLDAFLRHGKADVLVGALRDPAASQRRRSAAPCSRSQLGHCPAVGPPLVRQRRATVRGSRRIHGSWGARVRRCGNGSWSCLRGVESSRHPTP